MKGVGRGLFWYVTPRASPRHFQPNKRAANWAKYDDATFLVMAGSHARSILDSRTSAQQLPLQVDMSFHMYHAQVNRDALQT
jgi:hypothetical protein